MKSLKSPFVRFFYFLLLTISFSSCTSSCECDVESISCSTDLESYKHYISGIQNDSLLFVASDSTTFGFITGDLDSSIQEEAECSDKSYGKCGCNDCESYYTLELISLDIDTNENGQIQLYSPKVFDITSQEMMAGSSRLSFNLGFISKYYISLPLNNSSLQNQYDYYDELEINGKKFHNVYRFFNIENVEGQITESPGSIYFSKEAGIIGFNHPVSGMDYVRRK